jgi:hypothetical protein
MLATWRATTSSHRKTKGRLIKSKVMARARHGKNKAWQEQDIAQLNA